MNIFFVHRDPALAAQMLCDKHVVKMTLETAQILCTAVPDDFPGKYKPTHARHPCVRWAADSIEHYRWLVAHLHALGAEYSHRYGGKVHASMKVWQRLPPSPNLPRAGWRDPPACMPDMYKTHDIVSSYRRYYVGNKGGFAKWTNRKPPRWFSTLQQSSNLNSETTSLSAA